PHAARVSDTGTGLAPRMADLSAGRPQASESQQRDPRVAYGRGIGHPPRGNQHLRRSDFAPSPSRQSGFPQTVGAHRAGPSRSALDHAPVCGAVGPRLSLRLRAGNRVAAPSPRMIQGWGLSLLDPLPPGNGNRKRSRGTQGMEWGDFRFSKSYQRVVHMESISSLYRQGDIKSSLPAPSGYKGWDRAIARVRVRWMRDVCPDAASGI